MCISNVKLNKLSGVYEVDCQTRDTYKYILQAFKSLEIISKTQTKGANLIFLRPTDYKICENISMVFFQVYLEFIQILLKMSWILLWVGNNLLY